LQKKPAERLRLIQEEAWLLELQLHEAAQWIWQPPCLLFPTALELKG
jgi:hypothetical protein